jgi:two-component system chemotaxis response regulator CheV
MSDTSDIRKLQLEVGGTFFELIEFTLTRHIGGKTLTGTYGVNVAKVREVVRMPKINALASRVKGVAGVFELRGVPIPAVSLAVALGDEPSEPRPTQQIIVTEFSRKRAGFVVDATRRIRRVAWDKVLPPSGNAGSFMSGMALIDDNEFLFILDLERILMVLEHQSQVASGMPVDMLGFARQQMAAEAYQSCELPTARPAAAMQFGGGGTSASSSFGAGGGGPSILLVDDSAFIRNGVKQALVRAGYAVTEASDGVEAYALVEAKQFALVISDVEMPRMDGLSLTKKIRSNPRLAELPVVLHTSLSGKANQQAGLVVGANGYVIKNDFRTLFELIKEILGQDAPQVLGA